MNNVTPKDLINLFSLSPEALYLVKTTALEAQKICQELKLDERDINALDMVMSWIQNMDSQLKGMANMINKAAAEGEQGEEAGDNSVVEE